RRIIRRAIRHGYQLGQHQPFFYRLVDALDGQMGKAYPELRKAKGLVARVLKLEEERFAETIEHGMRILDDAIAGLDGRVIPGHVVFKLYDTYGFPTDLTADIAREKEMEIDREGFEREMDAQRARARSASNFGAEQAAEFDIEGETDFTGYDELQDTGIVVALFSDGESADQLNTGQAGLVVLDRTPFYAESGGQAGDAGHLRVAGGADFEVSDTRKKAGTVFAHVGKLKTGVLRVGDSVTAEVDSRRRAATALNHSATHLLHAALRQVLGDHVGQKGSLVEAERLRFDFSHFEPVSREQLIEIERLVNEQIRTNHLVETRIMALEDAKTSGAMALFGEKYDEYVRVLRMGDFSTELCGGTHVKASGDIGLFKITVETGIASGVRRIEAVTGARALEWIEADEERLLRLGGLINAGKDELEDKLSRLIERNRKLEKELDQIKSKLASAAGSDLASQAVSVGDAKVLAARLDGVDPKSLRDTLDQLKNKLGSAVILLAAVNGDRVNLIAGVTKDLTDRCRAGDLVKLAAEQVGGKGGGRPDMAQAGGTDPAGVTAALELAQAWASERL
ncbi:MAG: alanine--tRNA ligase, partial [Sedimenticolaceae bacterium]